MKKNFNVKRKGFTLVELLIVIVVIGVLSAMMMLSSTEAVTSAKASNIVSNLRNLKTAALAMYVDSYDKFADTTTKAQPKLSDVQPYMSNSNTTEGGGWTGYGVATEGEAGHQVIYVFYNTATGDSKIAEKLAGRAKSVGLLGSTTALTDGAQTVGTLTDPYVSSNASVVMKAQ